MYLLDTNHLSTLERRGLEAETLLNRLVEVPAAQVVVTVISYEEQIRGWMAAVSRAKDSIAQVFFYQKLMDQLENYCNLSLLPFDNESAAQFDALRAQHRRLSAPDLKIAAIALVKGATLLTRNTRDFHAISELQVEDWTRLKTGQ